MKEIHSPLVSIITPSFNQGQFIEETIESILTQDYSNIEHIVVDGGSTDGTLEILEKYSKRDPRFRFISEPDRGQAHAINKGLKMAQGEIIGWLNSDDTYLPGAIDKAVNAFNINHNWAMVYGRGYHIDENNKIINSYPVKKYERLEDFFDFCIICQPAAFIRKDILESVGGLDESYHFSLDYDLWIRIAKKYPIGFIDHYLANTRLHADAKTTARVLDLGIPEIMKVSNTHFGTVANNWLYHFLTHHIECGSYWYLNLFKKYNVFGYMPKIKNMNRYADLWIPENFQIDIQINTDYPLEKLLIKGIVNEFEQISFYVSVNDKIVGDYSLENGSFELELPVLSNQSDCRINMISKQHFVPAHCSDTRRLCFLVHEVLPLSKIEYEFYQAFQKGSRYVCNWLSQNRRSTPVLQHVKKIGINLLKLWPGKIGGAEQYIRSLVDYMFSLPDYEIYLFLNHHSYGAFEIKNNERIRKIGIILLNNQKEIDAQFNKWISLLKIDLWFCPLFELMPQNINIPSVVTIHDIQHEFYPEFFPAEDLKWRRTNIEHAAKTANAIIAVSNFSRNTIIDKYKVPSEKVVTIYEDAPKEFNLNQFDNKLSEKVIIKYQLPEKYGLFPASTWPHKNHINLLKALLILRDKYKQAINIIFTGNKHAHPENYRQIQKFIDENELLHQVKFLDYIPQEEMPYMYKNSKFLVYPSLFEGFGIPLIEAMRANTPIICSNAASIPEIVEDSALLFNPFDVEDIAQKILEVLKDQLQKQLINKGKEQVKKFSWEKSARETLELFDKFL